ncbi:MAG: cell division protein SepF, partial [Bacillota bacterium]
PARFEDVQVIVDHLKSRRPIIINLEGVDNTLAKSLLDFICGATYALDGGMQKVNGSIFLIAPKDMDVASNLKDSLLAKDALVKNLDPHLPAGGGSND